MTTDHTAEQTMADYRQSLLLALRLRDVPGDRIGEVLAEVESHVSDTGEDPAEAFGAPRDYAKALTAGHAREPWWRTVLGALPFGIAGWLVAIGALDTLLGQTSLGQPGWVWFTLGLLIGIPAGVFVYRRGSRIRDPRTGVDMVPLTPLALLTLAAIPLGIILITWMIIEVVQ